MVKGTIEDVINMKLTNFTILGNCSRCGQCCSDLLHLDDNEIKRIDDYMKKHKLVQHNKGANNICCPFRNDETKSCEIYEVRPDICRVFKCDKTPKQAYEERDILNTGKAVRSMAQLFFKDNSKATFVKRNLFIKVKKR